MLSVLFDSTRIDWRMDAEDEPDDSDIDSVWSDEDNCLVADEELTEILMKLAKKEEVNDPDWLPKMDVGKPTAASEKSEAQFQLQRC